MDSAFGEMTPDELAEAIHAVLVTADDAGMSIETQVDVLERSPRRCAMR